MTLQSSSDSEVIHITPPATALFLGQSVPFLSDDASATWSVEEGAAGGSIDTSGLYTAPAMPGGYHWWRPRAATSATAPPPPSTCWRRVSLLVPRPRSAALAPTRPALRASTASTSRWPLANTGGTIYFTTQDKLLRTLDVASGTLGTLAGVLDYPAPIDGVGHAAHFGGLQGIVADGIGNLYVADVDNDAIRKVVIATGAVTTFAGKLGMYGFVDGAPGTAMLGGIYGLAFDGAGTLYFADTNCRASPRSTWRARWSRPSPGPCRPPWRHPCGSGDGTGTSASFSPQSSSCSGTALATSTLSTPATIRRIDVCTDFVTTILKGIDQYDHFSWDGPLDLVHRQQPIQQVTPGLASSCTLDDPSGARRSSSPTVSPPSPRTAASTSATSRPSARSIRPQAR